MAGRDREVLHLVAARPGLQQQLVRLTERICEIRPHDDREDLLAELVDRRGPALVLVDCGAAPGAAVREVVAIRQSTPALIIVVSEDGAPAQVVGAMKAGAIEYLVPPIDDAVLTKAIRTGLAVARLPQAGVAPALTADVFGQLTQRQREVLGELLRGATSKEIARRLEISPRTVEVHRAAVMGKMQVDSLAQLVARTLALLYGSAIGLDGVPWSWPEADEDPEGDGRAGWRRDDPV